MGTAFGHDIGAYIDVHVLEAATTASGGATTPAQIIDLWGSTNGPRPQSVSIWVAGSVTGDAGAEGLTLADITVQTSPNANMSSPTALLTTVDLDEIVSGDATLLFRKHIATFDSAELYRYLHLETYTPTNTGTGTEFAFVAVAANHDKLPVVAAEN